MFENCLTVNDWHAWSMLSVAGGELYGCFAGCRLCVTVVIWVRARGLLGTAAGLAGFVGCRGVRH